MGIATSIPSTANSNAKRFKGATTADTCNKRTAVERVNLRLKGFTKLDNLKVRGLAKIRLLGLLAMLTLNE